MELPDYMAYRGLKVSDIDNIYGLARRLDQFTDYDWVATANVWIYSVTKEGVEDEDQDSNVSDGK